MKQYYWLILIVVALVAVGCSEENGNSNDGDQNLGPLDWEREADTIILRLDARRPNDPAAQQVGEIPACTLWGDGRLVWMNELEDGQEVLEARLNDEEVRSLLEFVIFSGFYDWESDFIVEDGSNPTIESMTLNLYEDTFTLQRFSDWPADGYERILQRCREASSTPVLFLPDGGWLSAIEVPQIEGVGYWRWPGPNVGIELAQLVNSEPVWIEGDLARRIWENNVEDPAPSRVLEEEIAYQLVLQVPQITRDSPPRPVEE